MPLYLCALNMYHVTLVATLSVRILVVGTCSELFLYFCVALLLGVSMDCFTLGYKHLGQFMAYDK